MQPTQSGKDRNDSAWRWWLLAVLIALVVFITAPPRAASATVGANDARRLGVQDPGFVA
jgi:hypothetical protein